MKQALWVGLAAATLGSSSAAAQPTVPPAAREFIAQEAPARWTQMLSEGDSIFHNGSCWRCHGEDAKGTRRGPDLTDDVWVQNDGTMSGIYNTIFWGVRQDEVTNPDFPFAMNPKGSLSLDWYQTRSLAAYVWSLSNLPADE